MLNERLITRASLVGGFVLLAFSCVEDESSESSGTDCADGSCSTTTSHLCEELSHDECLQRADCRWDGDPSSGSALGEGGGSGSGSSGACESTPSEPDDPTCPEDIDCAELDDLNECHACATTCVIDWICPDIPEPPDPGPEGQYVVDSLGRVNGCRGSCRLATQEGEPEETPCHQKDWAECAEAAAAGVCRLIDPLCLDCDEDDAYCQTYCLADVCDSVCDNPPAPVCPAENETAEPTYDLNGCIVSWSCHAHKTACAGLRAAYQDLLQSAKRCVVGSDPSPCTATVYATIDCPCQVYVNGKNTTEITQLTTLRNSWSLFPCGLDAKCECEQISETVCKKSTSEGGLASCQSS